MSLLLSAFLALVAPPRNGEELIGQDHREAGDPSNEGAAHFHVGDVGDVSDGDVGDGDGGCKDWL